MRTLLKTILIFGFIFTLRTNVWAQSVVWRQIIGEQFNEVGNNCIELRDGGFMMAGYKNILLINTSILIQKSYLVRFDNNGNILWEKILGNPSSSNSSETLIEDPFGNIYLPFYENSARLAKLNSNGQILWIKNYSSFQIEGFSGIEFVDDYKNIVLLGQNLVQGFRTSSVTKLDSSGNLIWNKSYYDTLSLLGTYKSSNNSFWFSGNEYYFCGFITPSLGVENRVGFIIKLDTNGNILWNKRYPQCKGIFSIASNSSNTFIACGQAEATGYLYCQKFDSSGTVIWNRNYRSDKLAEGVGYLRIIKNRNNNFALGTPNGNNFGRLLIIDSLGHILSSKFYYYPPNFYISQNNMNNTTDSGYIVSGSLDSNNIYDNSVSGTKRIDALIFKIDKNGNTVSIKNNNSQPHQFKLSQNFPNPFNPTTTIPFSIFKNSFVKLKVFDITGKVIKTLVNNYKQAGSYNVTFDASNLPSGVYHYKISSDENTSVKRMVLLK